MIEESLQEAISIVNNSRSAYCHYITPNDVGATGGHQCGFTFGKQFYSLFFDEPGMKGANKDVIISINWQNQFDTESRVIYYGVGTRNEYRITRFGRGFEFLRDDYIGSLMIMTKNPDNEYRAYVLSNQTNIEDFCASFNLDITKGNQWVNHSSISPDELVSDRFNSFVESCVDFPDTIQMANFARDCISEAYHFTPATIANNSDKVILQWVEAEYQLFSKMEEKIYRPFYSRPFQNCQDLITFANSILNRRKSRAGKSLEHHLSTIFTSANLRFEEQVITEENKRPDFIFPDGESYHNFAFPADKLTILGAKTTCKDRWRQVLNEADRIDHKHLFTLQQGISKNQLSEMANEHLSLVVPKSNMHLFDSSFNNIISLSDFIGMVREQQA